MKGWVDLSNVSEFLAKGNYMPKKWRCSNSNLESPNRESRALSTRSTCLTITMYSHLTESGLGKPCLFIAVNPRSEAYQNRPKQQMITYQTSQIKCNSAFEGARTESGNKCIFRPYKIAAWIAIACCGNWTQEIMRRYSLKYTRLHKHNASQNSFTEI
jgi:hypothetical protein